MKGLILGLLIGALQLCADLPQEAQEVVVNFMRQKQIPGVAAAVYTQGQSYLLNFGHSHPARKVEVTPDTLFEIASITKVFTSEALAVEVLNGRMQLDAPLTNYLPGLKGNRFLNGVTLRALASHSASMPRVPPGRGYTPEKLMRYFALQWHPEWPVGTKYLYSNVGFGLLGYALAAVEGVPYYRVLEKSILQPLKMENTWIIVPQAMRGNYAQGFGRDGRPAAQYALNAWPGGGALRSTSRDMLKFLLANLDIEGPGGLRKAMQFAQQGVFKATEHLTLALGWQRFQAGAKELLIIDKNGGVDGFSSYIGMVPDQKIGVVLLANRGGTQITEAGRELLRVLVKRAGNGPLQRPAATANRE